MMVLAHKPVRGVADFQGQKFRTPGGAAIQIEPFRKLGVQPVSIPLGEVLPAMQNHPHRWPDYRARGIRGTSNMPISPRRQRICRGRFIFVPVAANRQFLQKIGPELAAIVREEALKAQTVYTDWNIADAQSCRGRVAQELAASWSPCLLLTDKRYLDITSAVTQQVLSSNPKIKDDYDALLAAAKKHHR